MMDIEAILLRKESECFDKKREYHKNNAQQLHDILCLANAEVDKYRMLVFGISDDGIVVGVEKDPNRKKQSDFLNLLSSSFINKPPQISLCTIASQGHEIDILIIENRPEKPYFLIKDKTFQGVTVRAGVTYTRYGDTNTPINGCADELSLERMFKERLAIDKSPLEKVKINLRKVADWKWGENENHESYYYYECDPDFTLSNNSSTEFNDGWNLQFPSGRAYKNEYFLKYRTTLLQRVYIVSCDGGRYDVVLPECWLRNKNGRDYQSNFYVEDSLEYLVHQMIRKVGPANHWRGLSPPPFPIFLSKEEAERTLNLDFENGMLDYIYYYFDRESQRDICIKGGQSKEIFSS